MQQIGRYRITGELGRGAMGVVYRAEDPTIGRTVAIKTIRFAEHATDEEREFLRERLFREARSAGILSHPGIVTIYDVLEQDGVCYVFMEYVDGPTLEAMMSAKEAVEKHLILRILERAGEALDYAHSQGIVHRDIKPSNIMLTSRGAVKITDFGVAKFVSQQATVSGMILGTPVYMSPEQIADDPVDGRADQFSLAVIAYQLITGERPFTGDSLPSLMYKIVNDEPEPVQRLNATLSGSVDTVLRKALSKNALNRYETCTGFAKALTGACESRRDWKPNPAGAALSMETVVEVAAKAPVLQMPVAAARSAPAARIAAESSTGARARSSGGKRALVAFLTGFVIVGGLAFVLGQFVLGERAREIAATPPKETVEVNKPSAMGPAIPPAVPEPVEVNPDPPKPEPSPVETKPVETKAAETKAVKREPAAVPVDANVRVVTSPPGAKVMFDGQPRSMCTTPCEMTFPSGRHTLAAMMDGYRTQSRIVQLPNDGEVIIMLERSTGTLMLRSNPAGATILINGQERKEKTPAMLSLPVGKHRLDLFKEGLGRQSQEIEIGDGVVSHVDIAWGAR